MQPQSSLQDFQLGQLESFLSLKVFTASSGEGFVNHGTFWAFQVV